MERLTEEKVEGKHLPKDRGPGVSNATAPHWLESPNQLTRLTLD